MSIKHGELPLLETKQLWRTFADKHSIFRRQQQGLHVLQGIDLSINAGEVLGIVGESGCGKSTLARLLVGLDRPSQGVVYFNGLPILGNDSSSTHVLGITNKRNNIINKRNKKLLAKSIQYVFQDAVSALNPRKVVAMSLQEPMQYLLGMANKHFQPRLKQLIDQVKLPDEILQRYPHELSGGQAQRVGIARALAANPQILVLDEPVSALDVSVQAQVLNVLLELKQTHKLTYVFISHDLSVVERISQRVVVMYFGRVVEQGSVNDVFHQPCHPYTRLLLASIPKLNQSLAIEVAENSAELPDPFNPPIGCAFAPRCPRAKATCFQEKPALTAMPGEGHIAACHFPHLP
ncbi:oligopeptide/dipeptide ABC transporter ATP-binding protein [Zooshikella harenae]|uniref:ABC transporter ATP-binding protein n=1 Tax=Zooshikella harenae TaxID=2827238 RepID=A0ABS5ZFX5_9GAMM|nr:ABC transporter ATP-binding protein [Zooshikella harenae]MBU2712958.1 ABC transporter ATP-binding protein [Zooshikella harenae]